MTVVEMIRLPIASVGNDEAEGLLAEVDKLRDELRRKAQGLAAVAWTSGDIKICMRYWRRSRSLFAIIDTATDHISGGRLVEARNSLSRSIGTREPM